MAGSNSGSLQRVWPLPQLLPLLLVLVITAAPLAKASGLSRFDVGIYGATPAGITAAVSAARQNQT
jgi:hypothetical protein